MLNYQRVDFRSTTMSFQDMAMDQYLYIAFLGGWTSTNPSYFDVNYRGTRFWPIPISRHEIWGFSTKSLIFRAHDWSVQDWSIFSVAVKVDYNIFWLVVEKYESQWEGLSHILWIIYIYISGWWFEHLVFFHLLGMSSSQLTFIFFRGVETTNQNNVVYPFIIIHH